MMLKRENPHPGKREPEIFARSVRREDDSRDEYQLFERLISDLSARFVNIASDQVDGETERALKHILDYFQVDRCGLLVFLLTGNECMSPMPPMQKGSSG